MGLHRRGISQCGLGCKGREKVALRSVICLVKLVHHTSQLRFDLKLSSEGTWRQSQYFH